MSKNVLIPLSLLYHIIDLLGYWNTSEYDPVIRDEYDRVLWALNSKVQKLEQRDTYSKIIAANNQDDRHDARIRYLQQKYWLEQKPPF